jgi:peptidoglycan/xylan/chitin deacetylase (PgdA/CDA1 family)
MPRAGTAALLVALALAVSLEGCATARPGWTYAPPTPIPGASGAASAGAGAPTGTVAAVTPSTVPVAVRPTPWVPPKPEPTPAPTPIPPAARHPVAVPILYYHRVAAPPRGFRRWPKARQRRFLAYDVIPAAFEAQLDWLKSNGYTTILPGALAAYWDEGTPLPPRPVMITFDDGTHDWTWNVLPALQARGMIAEFYVTLASIPSGGMSWAELRAIVRAGNGIGAHGLHHHQLAALPGPRGAATPAVMRWEMARPRVVLRQRLGVVPDSVAYVGGGFNENLQAIVKEAGYTTARSIRGGRTQARGNRFELRVIRVGWQLDVVDVVKGEVRLGVPGFARLIEGR